MTEQNSSFPQLMSEGKIGNLQLRNRIVMSGMGTNLSESDGHCGERIQSYYEARARGGCGLVIMGVGSVSWPSGACNPNQVAVSSDEFLPGLKSIAKRVKSHGAKIAIQLQHAGQVAVRDIAEGRTMLVPSKPKAKAPDMMDTLSEEEMAMFVRSYSGEKARIEYKIADREDIAQLIKDFASAAARLKKAGFDGVELHAAHGYILSSFLSASVNRRDDEYGGSHENRCRLLVETLRAVRERVGSSFGVWCRIDAKEHGMQDGIELEDAIATAKMAEAAGADAIHVSSYADSSKGIMFTTAPLTHAPLAYLPAAAEIKKAVRVPVIGVGRIEPDQAEHALASGQVDFIAMARKLLADPELPNKLKEQRAAEIRPCIYCYTCVSQIFVNKSACCAVNPATGFENDFAITAAKKPRKVLVIGGGPAGMEAARVAALRGHQVTLCERDERLGGTLFFAALAYPENGALLRHLQQEMARLPVDVQLGRSINAEEAKAMAPDAIVIASGAARGGGSDIKGANAAHVFDGAQLRGLLDGSSEEALAKLDFARRAMVQIGIRLGVAQDPRRLHSLSRWWMPLGKRVVIIGGGLVGIELAEFLSERGRKVAVIESGAIFGRELAVVRRWQVLDALKRHQVSLMPQAEVRAIDLNGVIYSQHVDGENGENGERARKIGADSVILANDARAENPLEGELKGVAKKVRSVGDCVELGYIVGAMRSGARAGLDI